jgi:hypothetical protein
MTPRPSLLSALRRLLRPLVKLLTAQGLTYPMLADLLKQIYVDVAVREFALGEAAPTDSRVSLLTGVHRKDVKRLRGAPVTDERCRRRSRSAARRRGPPARAGDRGGRGRCRGEPGRRALVRALVASISRTSAHARCSTNGCGRRGGLGYLTA